MISLEAILGWGIVVLFLLLIVTVVSYAFWLWMFIDAAKRGDALWIVLFVVSFFLWALSGVLATVYYYSVYKKARGGSSTHTEENI